MNNSFFSIFVATYYLPQSQISFYYCENLKKVQHKEKKTCHSRKLDVVFPEVEVS